MKAVLLAAGVGERLRPLTDRVPKCLVPLGGVPIVERNIQWLRRHGVTQLAVNLHHLPDVVRAHLSDGSHLGVEIHYLEEPTLLGTAGTVGSLSDWLADEPVFLVFYADNLLELDLHRLLARHAAEGATVSVALFHRDDVSFSGVAELDGDDRIRGFVEKPSPGSTTSHWVNAGLLACSHEVLGAIPEPPADFGHDVLPALVRAGRPVLGFRMGPDDLLVWIDRPEDLATAEDRLRSSGHGVAAQPE